MKKIMRKENRPTLAKRTTYRDDPNSNNVTFKSSVKTKEQPGTVGQLNTNETRINGV